MMNEAVDTDVSNKMSHHMARNLHFRYVVLKKNY